MLENNFIKPITTDTDLVELARLLNVQLNGIIDIRDANNLPHEGSYIILLRTGDSTGHWKLGLTKYNNIQYQGSKNDFCGIYCLLWLYSKQKNDPDVLKGFIDLDTDIS
ncbi:TPA: hypothetical protein N0F65_001471 [Lagenidium giganteum]|uniref:Uncharacterized protein n=1 Tax=Lagenidium giganteum TaxID=4803 RepID=A0AAV2YG10_9STRA|nr:TPA: hypothetical protein N0F65_001471 [Lagenidium giganteum]